ncbi:MAG TPA: ribokinase [Candidatus Acidoferrales bacterium]|nr:ribokinase [Candidatus Acidoferrales bacterium]
MRKPIVVVGSINLDLVATAERVPLPGETLTGRAFTTFHGGKGANQAVAVGRLGYPVGMVGKVGDDTFGTQLKSALRKAGVDARAVGTVRGSSGVALINIGDDGQNNIVVVPGANGKLLPKDITQSSALLRKAGMLLTQLEIPLITMETLAVFAHKNKIPLMLDPAPARELPTGLLQCVTWITPNESETRTLCGLDANEPVTPATAERCANLLLERGPKNVVIKMGSQGAFLATSTGTREMIPPFAVKAVDSTAAGDAFNAGFAVSLLSGSAPVQAARFASAVAAISVTRRGAQPSMPSLREVNRFLATDAHAKPPQATSDRYGAYPKT